MAYDSLSAPHSRRTAGWAVALGLALSGCASLAPRDSGLPQIAVPAGWSGGAAAAAASSASLVDWWQRFNDPLLATLVAQALQANTDVRSAQAALQQARALRDVAAGRRRLRIRR